DGEDCLRPGGLGGGACRRHWAPCQERIAGESARLRRRLHRGQRSLSARPRAAREHQRHLPIQVRLDQTQDLRWLVSARPVDCAGERHRRPAKSRPQAVGERRAQAGLQQQGHDLQPGRADRAIVERYDASPRRPDSDRHAGRRRLGARGIPQGRRCGQDLDRENRDADQQDGLIARFNPFLRMTRRHVVYGCRPNTCAGCIQTIVLYKWRWMSTSRRPLGRASQERLSSREQRQGGMAAWPSSTSERPLSSRTATGESSSLEITRSAYSDTRVSSTPTAISACTRAAPRARASPSPRSRNGCYPTRPRKGSTSRTAKCISCVPGTATNTTGRPANACPTAGSSSANTKWSRKGMRFMSSPKAARTARRAAHPAAKRMPARPAASKVANGAAGSAEAKRLAAE